MLVQQQSYAIGGSDDLIKRVGKSLWVRSEIKMLEPVMCMFYLYSLKSGLHESLNELEAGKLQFTLLMTEMTAEGAAVETASLT